MFSVLTINCRIKWGGGTFYSARESMILRNLRKKYISPSRAASTVCGHVSCSKFFPKLSFLLISDYFGEKKTKFQAWRKALRAFFLAWKKISTGNHPPPP